MTEERTGEMGRGQASPFGARLRQFREAAGLTQEELATRADLGAKNISDLERGVRKHPYPHTIRSLADALKLSEEERAALFAAVPKRGGGGRAARAVAPEPTLPEPPTPLVGRERDLEEVKAFLARPEVRLFTLTGTGGVGKTRLAVHAAWDAADLFPDGVAFVALASVGNSSLVVPTVCRTLGLRETEGTTPREALRVHLRDKELLLVLDNFEHVLEAAPEVAELIGSAANLTVLCTSRAPLHIRGEQEYPVAPLALPASTRAPEPAEVLASPSGRLFAERAQAASPTFWITEDNAAAVAAICWRLAGLPLALELAAAKSRFLDPTTLLSRLDRALSTGSTRDVPDRQRTLRATLDWSYDRLDVPERALFRRLSVFAGDFSFEAAEAVGPAEEVGSEEILDLLGGLVNQSLLVAEVTSGQEVRYRMLEPVRQYAVEKLKQSGDAGDAHREHASFFLALAERAHPELMGRRQVEWLDRLDQDYSNLRAAMSWALDADHAGTAARMGWALWHFWWIRGHHREGRRWMELVLERDLYPALRARALVATGTLAFSHGDYERCERYAKEGLELSRQVGDERRAAWARVGLGVVAMSRTDHEVATPHLQEALRSFRELDEDFGVARMTACLGMVALMRGEEAKAIPMFEEGLAVARRIGDRTSAYITLYSLALMALSRGDHDNAATLFEEGITVSEQVGDLANVAYCLKGLGMVAGARYQMERCARLFGAAEGLLEDVGSPVYNYYEPDPRLYERNLSAARSRLGEAAFEKARKRGRAMTFEQAVAYALSSAELSQGEAKSAEPPQVRKPNKSLGPRPSA
jgi:predicted ATPase/DNA-binding XRE family transcriptional regulator/Tfp pilus assembly protein PilF